MTRQLRPRKSAVNYNLSASLGDEQDDRIEEDVASGSDFDPGQEPDHPTAVDDQNVSAEDDIEEDDEEEDELQTPSTSRLKPGKTVSFSAGTATRTKRKVKASQSVTQGANIIGPGFIRRPSTSSTLSTTKSKAKGPNPHHRHRAIPIYSHFSLVESFKTKPRSPFITADKEHVKSFTHDTSVTGRVGRAWGFNVGPGPLWELVEDRGWYKEARVGEADEASRRPRVHKDVKAGEWEILDPEQANIYLPSADETTEDGSLQPPIPINCSFGPIDSQTRISLTTFDSKPISEFIPGSKSHIFSAGGPIWGLDWCPLHPSDRPTHGYKSYLAVAPFPSMKHAPDVGVKVARPSYACIQIWSFGPEDAEDEDEEGKVRCEMVLCLDTGPAMEIQWCPLPSNSSTKHKGQGKEKEGRPTGERLGLLAGTFEDGSLSIFSVPDPLQFDSYRDKDKDEPVFIKCSEPLIRIELEDTACWSLDWANSEVIAVGTTNGSIAVYNIAQALHNPNPGELLFPACYLANVHQAGVRSLSWVRVPPFPSSSSSGEGEGDPTVIASGGYDGVVFLTDIRDSRQSLVNRTRDVITSVEYIPYLSGFLTLDHENTVKSYSVSPLMLGRGQTVMEANGPIWSIGPSDYHPQVAVGSADGTCSTTNGLRATRRGGSVPFFVHKIYQLDYSRKTGEYRMVERFIPIETIDRPSLKAKKPAHVPPIGTGAWSSEVGVHRVVWNDKNGLEYANVLASGTAAGLVRIDRLEGRWFQDKIPYGSVAYMRGGEEGVSDDDAMDVD